MFYRLSEVEARRARTAVIAALPIVGFMGLRLADRDRAGMAIGFVSIMAILLGLIVFQISQSRRANSAEQGNLDG